MNINVQKNAAVFLLKLRLIKPDKKLWVSGHLLTLAVCCRFLIMTLDFKMISWAQHISTWSHWNTRGLYATCDFFSPSHKQFTSHTDNKPVHLLCTLFTYGIKVTCLTTQLMGKSRKCSCVRSEQVRVWKP